MINNINLLDLSGTYSYADYLKWTFEERIELFKGKIFKMSPAPNRIHQRVSGELFGVFYNYFKKHKCQLFHAPFDVRLPDSQKSTSDKSIFTVVQPDLCIICDDSKLDERGGIGAPDLIVEILSPGNTTREMKNKFRLYEEAGVREYWLVEPNDRIVLVYVLRAGKYIGLQPFTEEDNVESEIFEGLLVPVNELFN
jgi:Uma2 family endonuclease